MASNSVLFARARTTRAERRDHSRIGFAVAVWGLLIAGSWMVGNSLLSRPEPDMDLHAPPLMGRFDLFLEPGILAPVLVAAVVILGLHRARGLQWRRLLLAVFIGAFVWALSLAASEGMGSVTAPLEHPTDYLAAPLNDPPGLLVRGYIDAVNELPLHARAHPPGGVLLLSLLAHAGLVGSAVAAGAVIAVGASAGPAVLVAARSVIGQNRARSAAPFLVLAPAALWVGTSMDALFMGVAAWAIALLVVATEPRRRSDGIAFGGGLVFGFSLFLSYGIVPLATIPLAVAAARRRVRPLLLAGGGAGLVFAMFALAGFWWFDGLSAAVRQYQDGISAHRPNEYFLVANLAALGVSTGPAGAAGLAAIRDKGLWLLVGGAVIAVLVADLSGLSKGEVERIWLPFVPWLLLAAGATDKSIVGWLSAQAGWTILIQAGVQTPW